MGNNVSQQDLAKYQLSAPKGDQYALKSFTESTYQPKGNYALTSDLANYQTVAPNGDQYTLKSYTDSTYQPKGSYALASDLAKYQTKGDYLSPPKGDEYALKSYTNATYVPQSDFKKFGQDYVKFVESIPSTYVQKDSFNALSNSLSPPKGEQYALKSYTDATYQPKGDYITRTDIQKFADEFYSFKESVPKTYARQDAVNTMSDSVKRLIISLPTVQSVAPTPAPIPGAGPWKLFEQPDGWSTPVRLNANGDIECMSNNAADCYWDGNKTTNLNRINNPPPEANKPLVCGSYLDKNHWCYKSMVMLNSSSSKLPKSHIKYLRNNNYLHY